VKTLTVGLVVGALAASGIHKLAQAAQNHIDDQVVNGIDEELQKLKIPPKKMPDARREAIALSALMSGLSSEQQKKLLASIERYEARHPTLVAA
jgi:hypothetical protein